MSQYEHLQVFKDIYQFNIYFHKLSIGFRRDIKYGLASEVRNLASYVMNQIVLANNVRDKRAYLTRAETSIELIKIKLRMLSDLKVIKVSSYRYSSEILINISRQISAWKKWTENGRSKNSQI